MVSYSARSYGTALGKQKTGVSGTGYHATKPASEEGSVSKHPSGTYAVRHEGFPTQHYHDRESAEKQLEKQRGWVSHTTWANKRGKETTVRHVNNFGLTGRADSFEADIKKKGYTIVRSHREDLHHLKEDLANLKKFSSF